MQNQLETALPITAQFIGGTETNAVCARRLHEALGIRQMYAHWIKAQIERGGLVDNVDYVVFAEFSKNPQGGRPANEYALSLDAAKHVCMMSQTEKGKQIRMYFIGCEKRLRQAFDPTKVSRLEMAKWLVDAEEKIIELQGRNKALSGKAQALDTIAAADGRLCITSAAKALNMRPRDFFAWLRSNRWIYRRPGGAADVAYQEKIQRGLLEHKVTTVSRSDGTEKVVEQALVTPKGLAKLAEVFGAKRLPGMA